MSSESLTALTLARDFERACAEATTFRSALEGLIHVVNVRLGPNLSYIVDRTDNPLEPSTPGEIGTAHDVQDVFGKFQARGASSCSLDFSTASFSGSVVFDAEGMGPDLDVLADALRDSGAAFARVAEVEELHRRLAETEDQVRHLTTVSDALPDPVVVLDFDDRILMANRRAELLFQSTPDDSPGRRRAIQANNLFFSAFRARFMLGESSASERELVLADPEDGSDLLFEVQAAWPDAAEHPGSKAVYILRDITDLKRATTELETQYRRLLATEHRLRRETDRLNVIIENAGVPILVTDDNSDIVLLNREAERLFEIEQLGARTRSEFRPMRSNDAALTGLISDFLLQPLDRREEELILLDPESNRRFPAKVTFTKILSPRGEPIAVVSVLHDLTSEAENQALAEKLSTLNAELEERVQDAVRELAEQNRQLEDQREALAVASRLKTEFVAMMSHELRTPLNTIMGYSDLLSEAGLLGELNADQDSALTKIHSASEHLLSLINDILDLSKVEAGKMALALEEVAIAPFVAEFAEGVRHLVEEVPIDFRALVDDGLPPVAVDPTRLRQVLINLVTNAVKFTDRGHVELRVGLDESGQGVVFEVEDTGIGIEEGNLEVIFEGFRQLEGFPTREQKGTGLGLAISRKLVAMMGGRLKVRSVYGEGSTFWFSVPLAEVVAPHPPEGGSRSTRDRRTPTADHATPIQHPARATERST